MLFLQLLIRHHQGGIEMAAAITESSTVPGVRARAISMINDQQQEITLMTVSLAGAGRPCSALSVSRPENTVYRRAGPEVPQQDARVAATAPTPLSGAPRAPGESPRHIAVSAGPGKRSRSAGPGRPGRVHRWERAKRPGVVPVQRVKAWVKAEASA